MKLEYPSIRTANPNRDALRDANVKVGQMTVGMHSCICLARILYLMGLRHARVGQAYKWMQFTRRYL